MQRPYKPLAFANRFIEKSKGTCEHMKLQKLTYIAYGWWLAFHDEAILNEEPQVWQHGPVFKSLYFTLNGFGRDAISTTQKETPFAPAPTISEDDTEANDLIDWIWNRYGSYGSFYLSDLTHQPGNPWYEVAKSLNFRVPHNTTIPRSLIKDHYRKLARANGFAVPG